MTALFTTNLPLPLHSRGKVRDTYATSNNELLMVATDRLSAFDVMLPTPIPEKGKVLTQLSLFWFDRTRHIVPNHLSRDQSIASELSAVCPDLGLRSMRVVRAQPVPFECVVRGFLAGSAWTDYQRSGEVCGHRLQAGLKENGPLPQPIFTPATKAVTGHDENISRFELARRTGTDMARELERLSLEIYEFARKEAARRGLIVADTKFEFGILDDRLILIDEVLTPDSSRFWPLNGYRPGANQPSFDKQYVRDYLERLGWSKRPPGPELPLEVVQQTRSRYREAAERFEVSLVPG